MNLSHFLTPSQVARRVGVSVGLVRYRIKRRTLATVPTPLGHLVDPHTADAWASERAVRRPKGSRGV